LERQSHACRDLRIVLVAVQLSLTVVMISKCSVLKNDRGKVQPRLKKKSAILIRTSFRSQPPHVDSRIFGLRPPLTLGHVRNTGIIRCNPTIPSALSTRLASLPKKLKILSTILPFYHFSRGALGALIGRRSKTFRIMGSDSAVGRWSFWVGIWRWNEDAPEV
jgi:hypothetical protein